MAFTAFHETSVFSRRNFTTNATVILSVLNLQLNISYAFSKAHSFRHTTSFPKHEQNQYAPKCNNPLRAKHPRAYNNKDRYFLRHRRYNAAPKFETAPYASSSIRVRSLSTPAREERFIVGNTSGP